MKKPVAQFDWDALRAEVASDVPDNAFSAYDWAARYKVGFHQSMGELQRLVKLGKLKTGLSCRNGRRARFYWPA